MRFFILALMIVCLAVGILDVQKELVEIKHMVNEVVCTALEMEETWAE